MSHLNFVPSDPKGLKDRMPVAGGFIPRCRDWINPSVTYVTKERIANIPAINRRATGMLPLRGAIRGTLWRKSECQSAATITPGNGGKMADKFLTV